MGDNNGSGLQAVMTLAVRLPPQDKVRLIERVASALERELQETGLAPRRSLYGWCADLGPAPSAEVIDEVRREAWSIFPREDIA